MIGLVPVVLVVLVVEVVLVVVPVVEVVLVVPVVAVVPVVPVVAVVLVVPVVEVVDVVLVVLVVVLVQVLYSWQRGTKNPRHPATPRISATTQMGTTLLRTPPCIGFNCIEGRSTSLLARRRRPAALCQQHWLLHGIVLDIQHRTNGMDNGSDTDRGNHGFFRDSLLPQHVLMRVNTLAATVYRGGGQTP